MLHSFQTINALFCGSERSNQLIKINVNKLEDKGALRYQKGTKKNISKKIIWCLMFGYHPQKGMGWPIIDPMVDILITTGAKHPKLIMYKGMGT